MRTAPGDRVGRLPRGSEDGTAFNSEVDGPMQILVPDLSEVEASNSRKVPFCRPCDVGLNKLVRLCLRGPGSVLVAEKELVAASDTVQPGQKLMCGLVCRGVGWE